MTVTAPSHPANLLSDGRKQTPVLHNHHQVPTGFSRPFHHRKAVTEASQFIRPGKLLFPAIRPRNIASQFHRCVGSPKMRYSPTLSISIHASLPSDLRNPRPTCCKYLASDKVGRASCTNSTSGQSNPSLNTSTFTSTSIFHV